MLGGPQGAGNCFLRVLLIESDSTQLGSVSAALADLGKEGTSLRQTPDLPEALTLLLSWQPQVVLWGIDRLDQGRLEQLESFCRHLYPLPLIVVVDAGAVRDTSLALLRGADDCLVKGEYSAETLARAIRHALARRQAYERVHSQGQRYCSIVENQSELICRFMPSGRLTFVNKAYCRYFGRSRRELLGSNFYDQVGDSDRDKLRRQVESLAPRSPLTRIELRSPAARFGLRWQRWTVQGFFHSRDSRLLELQAVGVDITERKRVEDSLLIAEANLRQLFMSNADGMIVTDLEGRVLFVNPAAEYMLGRGKDQLVGYVFPYRLEPGRRRELRLQPSPGKEAVVEMRVAHTRWQGQGAYLASLRDITELVNLRERLRSLSLVDELTLLYNRRGFSTLATQQIKTANRMRRLLLLFFIDLDDLKLINDRLGHTVGDQALKDAALILRQTFRESDILCRLGGDEFLALAMETEAEGAEAIIQRLQHNLEHWNQEDKRPYQLSLSVGVSFYNPERPCSLEELIDRADAEMYRRKRAKKEPVRLTETGRS